MPMGLGQGTRDEGSRAARSARITLCAKIALPFTVDLQYGNAAVSLQCAAGGRVGIWH